MGLGTSCIVALESGAYTASRDQGADFMVFRDLCMKVRRLRWLVAAALDSSLSAPNEFGAETAALQDVVQASTVRGAGNIALGSRAARSASMT